MATKKFFLEAEELRALYDRLESPAKVAKECGVSKKLILNYMDRYGIVRNKRKTLGSEELDVIRKMAADGCGAPEIASAIGFTTTAIRVHAAKMGISIADPAHPGYTKTDSGYIMVWNPDHPFCDKKGYVRQHRLVMEAHIGRYLTDDEAVHHIDYDRSNNDISNLQLMTRAEHSSLHVVRKDSGRWMHRKDAQQDIV